MRQRVRELLAGGADFIKIIATGAVLTAGTTPATPNTPRPKSARRSRKRRKRGTFVAAHAHGAEGIKNAVRAGVRTHRARLLPRRRGHRADGQARHLAGRRHLQRRLHRGSRHARRLVRGDPAQEPRDHRHPARRTSRRRSRRACASASAPTPASIRTATTRASSPTWCVRHDAAGGDPRRDDRAPPPRSAARRSSARSRPASSANIIAVKGDPLEDIERLRARVGRHLARATWSDREIPR